MNNPFAEMVTRGYAEHARVYAECFRASRDWEQLFAAERFARRMGLLPEGSYLDGACFDAVEGLRGKSGCTYYEPDTHDALCGDADDFLRTIAVAS